MGTQKYILVQEAYVGITTIEWSKILCITYRTNMSMCIVNVNTTYYKGLKKKKIAKLMRFIIE